MNPAAQAARTAEAYRATQSTAERDELIVQNLPLVKYVLGRLAVHFPAHVDRDDLMEAGVIGLMDASTKFDRSRNVQFRTYAIARIRGAILDEMRRLDWLPRSLRDELSRFETARESLRQRLNRPPTLAELAEELDVTPAKLDYIAGASGAENVYSLEDSRLDAINDSEFGSTLAARNDNYTQPADRIIFEEQKALLAEHIGCLPENERLVISLYYFENLLLREIGQVMGLSDSRVCQVHRAALLRLRRAMKENPNKERKPAKTK